MSPFVAIRGFKTASPERRISRMNTDGSGHRESRKGSRLIAVPFS